MQNIIGIDNNGGSHTLGIYSENTATPGEIATRGIRTQTQVISNNVLQTGLAVATYNYDVPAVPSGSIYLLDIASYRVILGSISAMTIILTAPQGAFIGGFGASVLGQPYAIFPKVYLIPTTFLRYQFTVNAVNTSIEIRTQFIDYKE